jgi:hypothetical protein
MFSPRVDLPGSFLPPLERLGSPKGEQSFASGNFLQDCLRLVCPVAEQEDGSLGAYVLSGVGEKCSQRVPPGIAVGAQLVEYGLVKPGVLVGQPDVVIFKGLGLRHDVAGEFFDELLKFFHQIFLMTLSIAVSPNLRWASKDCVLSH